MDSTIPLLSIAMAALTVCFAAMAEVALAAVSRQRMRAMLEAGQSRAQAAYTLLDEPERFLSTLLVLKTFAVLIAGVSAAYLAAQLAPGWQGTALALLLTGFVLLLCQIGPRALIVRNPDPVALQISGLTNLFAVILSPVTGVLRAFSRWIRGPGSINQSDENIFLSEDGLRFLLNADMGGGDSIIQQEEKEMIESIFEFGETLVREVMVPRIDIVALDVKSSLQEALDTVLSAGHSRIPIYHDTIDNIVGVLYAKDLLRAFQEGQEQSEVFKMLRTPYFIPESKKVNDLLGELQSRRVHIAIVVDEYGGTAGLVTIEDLLEEIVGDIRDEYDTAEEALVQEVGPDQYVFNARINLSEVNDLLHTNLPSTGGDTLGGFIYDQLGKVPAVDDTLSFDGVSMVVRSVNGRRIDEVLVARLPKDENQAEPETAPTLLHFWTVR